MNVITRWVQRVIILLVALLVIWFISTQVFDRLDERLSLFSALILTYIISAYLILPRVIHITSLVLRKGRIPRFTRANDGLPADPVNIILIGSYEDLKHAFKQVSWYEADRLTLKSAYKMARAFIRNKPYLTVPFSALFLFGRKQDIGFQKPIGTSPRKRHHIRFWAINRDEVADPLDIRYWKRKQTVDFSKPLMWIGAGTKDTGFGLTKLTYQISHAVDPDVDEERDYIISSLTNSHVLEKSTPYDSGTFNVGKYSSDGKIMVANLKALDSHVTL